MSGSRPGSYSSVLAFLPKALALILAIPSAVVAASIAVVMATLFAVGMREVVLGLGANPRNGLVAGVSFWTGVAFELDMIFPDFFAGFAGGLLSNGLTTGGLVALLLTALMGATEDPIQKQARRGRTASDHGVRSGVCCTQRPGGSRRAA